MEEVEADACQRQGRQRQYQSAQRRQQGSPGAATIAQRQQQADQDHRAADQPGHLAANPAQRRREPGDLIHILEAVVIRSEARKRCAALSRDIAEAHDADGGAARIEPQSLAHLTGGQRDPVRRAQRVGVCDGLLGTRD